MIKPLEDIANFANSTSLIVFLVSIVAFSVLLFGMLNYQLKLKEHSLKKERQRVDLELMRMSFEQKIYDLNQRMVSTEERWNDANHLVRESTFKTSNSKTDQTRNKFLEALGIDPNNISVTTRSAFVLTPFHEQFSDSYDSIQKALQEINFKVSRGDEEFLQGNILRHVVTKIMEAEIVVANIDGRNPNVFYELGIAHTLNKTVIVVTSSLDDVPFDLKNHLLLFWKTPFELKHKLTQSIAKL